MIRWRLLVSDETDDRQPDVHLAGTIEYFMNWFSMMRPAPAGGCARRAGERNGGVLSNTQCPTAPAALPHAAGTRACHSFSMEIVPPATAHGDCMRSMVQPDREKSPQVEQATYANGDFCYVLPCPAGGAHSVCKAIRKRPQKHLRPPQDGQKWSRR
jgi:hypothetical protein